MRSMILFNNKAGVGKTTLTFHVAHMMAREGLRVVALDYDPQANLTALFLDADRLETLWWNSDACQSTVARCVEPVRVGTGPLRQPQLEPVAPGLWLLPGELSLSRFEQRLAEAWARRADSSHERALDVTFALALLADLAGTQVGADVVLVDVGPNLGALNRAAVLACDNLVVPVAPDLFSLQGLADIGPTVREWREEIFHVRQKKTANPETAQFGRHDFAPLGYVVQQHLARVDRPVSSYAGWANQLPSSYARHVLATEPTPGPASMADDPNCIFTVKHMASLAPIAQQARKPMFDLKQADGIGGGQIQAVARCRADFRRLTRILLDRLRVRPDASDGAVKPGGAVPA